MLAHIPALVSAFLGGAALYLSVYLPTQALVFPTILAGFGTMLLAYSYGTTANDALTGSRCQTSLLAKPTASSAGTLIRASGR
jgi:hypothetical protein